MSSQTFAPEKLPTGHLDAVVIGSGIGGLGTAALLAKVARFHSIFAMIFSYTVICCYSDTFLTGLNCSRT